MRSVGSLLFVGGLVGTVLVFAAFFTLSERDSPMTWMLYRVLSWSAFLAIVSGFVLWIIGVVQSKRL